jgi:hypothetical protein
MGNALLLYGFPLILVLFEWALRTIIGVDSSEFIGPTLAATGLSFLVPLTEPKEDIVALAAGKIAKVRSEADKDFVPITMLFIFLFFFLWLASCYASLKHRDQVVSYRSFSMSLQAFIGWLAYLISLIMAGIKELLL